MQFKRHGVRGTRGHIAIALAIASAAIAMSVAGCGGSSSTAAGGSTSTGDSTAAQGSSTTTEGSSTAQGSSAPSKEFTKPGSPSNKIASFGSVAEESERESAAKVLEQSLHARATGDWAAQCATLSPAVGKELASLGQLAPSGRAKCPDTLRRLATPMAKTQKTRADTFSGKIAVLRVKGPEAYALYHGTNGKDYSIPMLKVGEKWTVSSLKTTPMP